VVIFLARAAEQQDVERGEPAASGAGKQRGQIVGGQRTKSQQRPATREHQHSARPRKRGLKLKTIEKFIRCCSTVRTISRIPSHYAKARRDAQRNRSSGGGGETSGSRGGSGNLRAGAADIGRSWAGRRRHKGQAWCDCRLDGSVAGLGAARASLQGREVAGARCR
jgi:hypothetical protein